jgi:hypothetical protein
MRPLTEEVRYHFFDCLQLLVRWLHLLSCSCVASQQRQAQPSPVPILLLQETKMVFEKLYKFIGKDIKSMMERPEGHYCLRLHKNRVYYVSEALMKKATNVSSSGGAGHL